MRSPIQPLLKAGSRYRLFASPILKHRRALAIMRFRAMAAVPASAAFARGLMPLRPAAEATAGQASRLDSQANRPLLICSSPALAGWVAFEKEVPMTTLLSKALAVGLCLEWLPAGAQANRTTPDPWPSALMAEAHECTTDIDSPIRAQTIPSCIALHVLRVPSGRREIRVVCYPVATSSIATECTG